jgi:hypothetical protein
MLFCTRLFPAIFLDIAKRDLPKPLENTEAFNEIGRVWLS